MKSVIGFLFLCISSYSIGQTNEWIWEWAKTQPVGTYSGCHSHMQIDRQGNLYTGYWFNDTITLGDTVFAHDSSTYCIAIMKTNCDGEFLKAVEIHGPEWGNPLDISFIVDSYQNLYIAGNFDDKIYIGDSIIRKGLNNPSWMQDIFIVKLDPDFKLVWSKVISGTAWDEFGCIATDEDEHLYLSSSHHRYIHQLAYVNYFGQDTANVPYNGYTDILQLNGNGDLIWKKKLTVESNVSINTEFITIGKDNYIYLTGKSYGNIILNGQVIQYPQCFQNFEAAFYINLNKDGEIQNATFLNIKMSILDMDISENGNLNLIGLTYNPCIIGSDTIVIPSGKLDYMILKLTSSLDPVWYKIIEMPAQEPPFPVYSFCVIQEKRDSVLFSLSCLNSFSMDSTYYVIGYYPQGFCGLIEPEGILNQYFLTNSPNGATIYDMNMDGCGNITIGGTYHNMAIFGDDTLFATNTSVLGERYFAKLRRYLPPPQFTLGPDTTLYTGSSIVLSLPEHYNYYWSTGDTTRELYLSASQLGIGRHKIWAMVGESGCEVSDTIVLIVTQNPFIPESYDVSNVIYPNPAEGNVTIKTDASKFSMELWNDLGILIKRFYQVLPSENKFILNVSELTSGLFYILIIEDSKTRVYKLMKN